MIDLPESGNLAFALAVFVLAGAVKGVAGLGLPTVAMGLLSIAMPPAEAAMLVVVPSLLTNVWQACTGPAFTRPLTRIASMQAGLVAGALLGGAAWGLTDSPWATTALGLTLVAYGAASLASLRMPAFVAASPKGGAVAGVATGAITAATGVFVVPSVIYLQALGLERDELVRAMGLTFTVATLALTVVLMAGGHYSNQAAGASVVMLLPALTGMAIGQRARKRLSPQGFRWCLMLALSILGAHLIVKSWL
jgi:uncharacterized membrane protein YfcA